MTAPTVGHLPVTVGVVADLGENCNTPGCGNATIKALSASAAAGELDLMVHAGDIAYTSGDQTIWDEFLREIEPVSTCKEEEEEEEG